MKHTVAESAQEGRTPPLAAPHRHGVARNLALGLLTAAPLLVTWLVLDFLASHLARLGAPWVAAMAAGLRPLSPEVAGILDAPVFRFILALCLALAALYGLGLAASRVLGRRAIAAFEALVARIPLVESIYGATRKFLHMVREKPAGVQRVVLIEFPHPGMKAVGFVTRILKDASTGEELASVYVPTTPNPTSGYIEIVPLARVVSTDWTMDEAMSFIITGGTSAPERIHYSVSAAPLADESTDQP
jgi:uncharacterized membrane protein